MNNLHVFRSSSSNNNNYYNVRLDLSPDSDLSRIERTALSFGYTSLDNQFHNYPVNVYEVMKRDAKIRLTRNDEGRTLLLYSSPANAAPDVGFLRLFRDNGGNLGELQTLLRAKNIRTQ